MAGARVELFFIIVIFVANIFAKPDNLKICVVGNPRLKFTRTTKYCDLLGKSKRTPVSCTYGSDRLECLAAVSRRQADFGIFEAEDLYFSTLWDESSVLVVSEIRSLKKKAFEYGTVVLVRKDGNVTGLADLRGKRLCHPGTGAGSEWNNLFSQYFEERIAPANCDENLSVMEDRIKTTSDFFASACKAGPWSPNPLEDVRLKKKYWNLCSLCDNGDCSNNEKYRGSGGSITCFKDGIGDVLWTRYEDVKTHLQFLESGSVDHTSDYYYLCDDGTLMMLTSEEPCYWAVKPWQVIAANRKAATDVQKIMNAISQEEHSEWGENLLHILELYLEYVHNLIVARTPEDYLRGIPGYLSASTMAQSNCKPKRSVKLCVTSALEQRKCLWMSKAAAAIAVQPSLECVQRPNISACLDSVVEQKTDVVVVPPDFLYDAVVKFDLKTLLIEAGNQFNDSYLVSVIVKKKSNVKNPTDLKGKTICLTRENGIGWRSVLAGLENESDAKPKCRDRPNLKEFFKEICVWEKEEGSTLPFCCPTMNRNVQGEIGLLACLYENGCDIAVVDFNIFGKNSTDEESRHGMKGSEFREICKTGKTLDCHWTWSYPNYLMTHSNWNTPKSSEVFNVFYHLGRVFGRNSSVSNPMMNIFEPFHGTNNVLFRGSSSSFISKKSKSCPNSYRDILDKIKLCSNSSFETKPALAVLFLVVGLSNCLKSILRLIA